MIEGSIIDWSAILLRESFAVEAGVAALGFAVYQGGMAIARFSGDWIRLRAGAVRMVSVSALLTAIGTSLALLAPTPLTSILAFFIAGISIGNVAPVLFAGGGRLEPTAPGRGIAAVSTLGYTGFLSGPPIEGATSMTFDGKRMIITGAGRGLGAALAIVLADKGARLLLTGRSRENLTAIAEAIKLRTGTKPDLRMLDMADASEVTLFAKALRDAGEPVDILINNAAQWLPGRMTDHDALAISQTIAANVTGTMLLTRGVVPLLEKSGAGDIMTVVSISGLPNARLQTASVAYAASKQAQAAISDGLRQELKGRPVRVQAIFPPYLEDLSPLDPAWNLAREATSAVTNRDIVDTILFALERPRHVTLASIIIDPDTGGLN